MKYCLIALLFAVSAFLHPKNIKEHLSTDVEYTNSNINSIDAVFIINLQRHRHLDDLKSEFQNHGMSVIEYNNFNKIPPQIINNFCSSIISPYLLTQTLSHLSIYQYCLDHNIRRALILESHAHIAQDPNILTQTIDHLTRTRPNWDIFYTDVDYHNESTGELIIPRLEGRPINKQVVDSNISKVLVRYGTTSYVISTSGMKKLLNHFTDWQDLPFDQILFNIQNLNIYGSNFDIITNKYAPEINQNTLPPEIEKKRPSYETGSEFWIDPTELLTYDRFDVAAKYIYAKYFLNRYETNWHIQLYTAHLEKWIHFYNTNPLKIGAEAFLNSFNSLLLSIGMSNFDLKSPIPINNLGLACDGSHRLGTCLALNIPAKVKVQSGNSSPGMSAAVFKDQYHLEEKYLDHMAYEYAKLKKNTYMVCLFPTALEFQEQIKAILEEHGIIVHRKDIELNETGAVEFIRLIYNGEWWIGSHLDDFKHSVAKAKLCFPANLKRTAQIYLYECDSEQTARQAKEKVRTYCQKGNEIIHINDSHEQTKVIAATVFNKNSIDFLNQKKLVCHQNFYTHVENFKDFVAKNNLDIESMCIDTGSVLAAYGLRDCNDFDVLHRNPLPKPTNGCDIDSHNVHLHHHKMKLDEILFNPENYFYYQGIKFLNIQLVKKMKLDRGSAKDLRDVHLIDSLRD